MNLSTQYLGFTLANPIVCGASPLVDNADTVKRLVDAGVSAFVLHSLFEEDIEKEVAAHDQIAAYGESFAEALSFFPEIDPSHTGPRQYLSLVQRVKRAVPVPVIASLNGSSVGGWTGYAKEIEAAGADALELNLYFLPTDTTENAQEIEERCLDIVAAVRQSIEIPLAVKLSPFFSAFAHFAKRLEQAGANGLVLFNRFYQPDIDVETLQVVPNLHLSTSEELRLRLRWLAVLSGQLGISLAATGGAHNALDVIKAVMAGADAVQMVSALLRHGPDHVRTVLGELRADGRASTTSRSPRCAGA
ncbi:MAG: dihydroorotate dehydrogenase-like protein [Candidatus Eisenbacteria bacterium]